MRWMVPAAILMLLAGPSEGRSLDEIRASGVLRVCVAGSSASFYRSNGEAFARFLGVRPETTQLPSFDSQFHNAQGVTVQADRYEAKRLADGSCDLFPNDLHILDWRTSKMRIVPYYRARKVVIANREKHATIKALSDLAGRTAAVQKGTSYDAWLQRQNEENFAVNPVIITHAPTAESVKAVAEGRADFTVVGSEGAFAWVRGDLGNLDIVFPVDDPVEVGWGLASGAPQLARELARFFAESTRVGTELDSNWHRYYGISLMEYRLFGAAFGFQEIQLEDILVWAIPAGGGGVLVLAVIVLANRRLSREVRERKAVEASLRLASERLGLAQEAGHVGVFEVDFVAGKNFWSPQLEQMFGLQPGSFGGTVEAWTALLHPEDRERAARTFAEAVDGGAMHCEDEFRSRLADGTVKTLKSLCRIVRGADGTPLRAVGVNVDVTELVTARQAAEDAARTKAMFLANMSHEIRTPMNAIIGLSYLALKTPLSGQQRDYLTKISNAGASLLALINDILDFSKVEAGRLEIEAVEFDLDDVLDNVASMISQRAYDKNLELVFDIDPGLPKALVGDPLRLGQVLINLVTNAIKFTEEGQIQVIARGAHLDGALQLQMSVSDTGIGMTAEQTARLFQSFSQVDGSTTRKYGGTGLGLAISKHLVEMMGGTIGVRSEPGRGSVFSFDVRVGLGDPSRQRRKTVPSGLVGLRALVVDDNASAREILVALLKGFGLEVSAVASGEAALGIVGGAAGPLPDVILVDWQMPGLDGIETARRIRALTGRPKLVMVTAFGREEVRGKAAEAGIDAFVVKPVSQSTMLDTLLSLYAPVPGETARALPPSVDDMSLAGIRLLLAEDNEINEQIAVELLVGAGARVDVAHNGREALDMLAAEAPDAYDAVLMDMQMPEMDGLEATRSIRGDVRYASLPVIAMTAHAMAEERESCMAAGMNDHVSKPIAPDALFRTLARWTGRAPAPVAMAIADDEPLPEIAGLDTAGGLKRVAGNRRLYLDLLQQFSTRYREAPHQVAKALEGGDRAAAERLAHTLKGVAGNLGLRALGDAAAAVETAIREGADAGTPLHRLEADIAAAVAALDSALAAVSPAAQGDASPDENAGQHAMHLAALLSRSDGDSIDYLNAHRRAIGSLFAHGAFATFESAVNGFDFDAAHELLQQAVATDGGPPAGDMKSGGATA